mgnify:CR=1 FL=1|jgi:DNA polymerase III subunit beta
MKFIISKEELTSLIGKIQNVISSKATIPILSNILIEAFNDEVIFTATDLTVGMRCFSDAKVLEEGAITVNAKCFFSLIRELTAVNIEVHVGDNELVEVKADSSSFKLHGKNKEEYPALPDLEGAVKFSIDSEKLKEMFYKTSFAVSRDDNRYILTGVCMSINDGNAVFMGTDGKRLSRANMDVDLNDGFAGQFIFPLKAVEEVLKILSGAGKVTVYLLNDKVAVESEKGIVITKLLTGDYPNADKVIPQTSEVAIELHREELMTLLRQVSLFTNEEHSSARFSFESGELKLNANSTDIGEGKVSMPVNYSETALDIAFNPHFFLDILKHTKDETVKLGLTDSFNPGVITDNSSALFVLMPQRLSEDL